MGSQQTNSGMRDALVGSVVSGKYKLLGRLDALGDAMVYEAEQVAVGRKVALKILAGHVQGPKWERFVRAARLAGKVSHPAVAAIYDVGTDSEIGGYLAMELCSGRELSQVLREQGPLSTPEAVALGQRILDALAAAHAQGVVHGCLEPKYLMVSSSRGDEPVVKILGFGLWEAGEHTQGAFVAPEVQAGDRPDVRSDIYSLGALLAATVGRLDFVEQAALQGWDEKALRFLLADRQDLETWLSFLSVALAPDPLDRFASAAQTAAALAALRLGSSTSEPGIAQVGELFGEYLILRTLARGGMGRVDLARPAAKPEARAVVVKTILPEHAGQPEFLEAFLSEARVAGRMAHPNVASVLEAGTVGDVHYMAMEYQPGKTCRDILERARQDGLPVPWQVAVYICREVAEGLAYAHRIRLGERVGVVHGDVSPENVFVTYEGSVKLLDFGLAGLSAIGGKMPVLGKKSFAAPEVLAGAVPGPKADIYAAGLVLGALLEPLASTRGRAAIPGAVWDIVARSTRMNPEERQDTAAALRSDLDRLLAAECLEGSCRDQLVLFVRRLFSTEYLAEVRLVGGLLTELPEVPGPSAVTAPSDARSMDVGLSGTQGETWEEKTIQAVVTRSEPAGQEEWADTTVRLVPRSTSRARNSRSGVKTRDRDK